MIETSPSIKSLMGAMLSVQRQVEGVPKDSRGARSNYASLEAVTDALREPCLEAGLVIVQAPGEYRDGTLALSTMIAHTESGEWMRSTLHLPVLKADPQMAGSAISYGRRYSLMALFCLPAVDDDGEVAARPPRAAESAPVAPRDEIGTIFSAIERAPDVRALVDWAHRVKFRLEPHGEETMSRFWSAVEARSKVLRAQAGAKHEPA